MSVGGRRDAEAQGRAELPGGSRGPSAQADVGGPLVRVQIVLFRSDRWLPRLAASLGKMRSTGSGFSVAAWDNTPDGSGAAKVTSELGWSYQRSPLGNIGFSQGHNALAAADSAGSEFLLLLNPDAAPFYDCLDRLLTVAIDNPDAALVEAAQFPLEHPKVYDPATLETNWTSAACLLVRRRAFDELGGFDPALFLYGEDVDLSWRAWRAGWRCLYVPGAHCIHVTQRQDQGKEHLRLEVLHQAVAGLYLRRKYFGEPEVHSYLAWLEDRYPPPLMESVKTAFSALSVAAERGPLDPHMTLDTEGSYGRRRW